MLLGGLWHGAAWRFVAWGGLHGGFLVAERAFQRQEHASVLLFIWGPHVLPVFLTSVKVDEKAHLASLVPYQAIVSLTMQVIEGSNPFYTAEKLRQSVSTALNVAQLTGVPLGGSI